VPGALEPVRRGARAAFLALLLALCPRLHAAEKLVVGVLPFVSSAPVFLAVEEGLYERYGVEVEIKTFRAAQPVALAVAAGDVQIGVTGLTAGFYNLANRGDLRIIGAQARVESGFHFVAYCVSTAAWERGFRSLEDFTGRKVGITQRGSTFHYMVGLLAEQKGFPLAGVRLVTLESVPNIIAARRGGSVDSVLLPGHLALPLERDGAAHILGWVGDHTPWQLGAVFTSTEVLNRRRPLVEGFLLAYRDAVALYSRAFLARDENGERTFGEAAEALGRKLTAYIPSTVPQILAAAPYIPPDARLTSADVDAQIRWFQAHGLVDRDLEPRRLVIADLAGSAPQVE